MKRTGTPDPIVVVRARSDNDLKAMIHVRAAADPHTPRPRLDNLRHNLAGNPDLAYLVARAQDSPVGCGFVDVSHASVCAGTCPRYAGSASPGSERRFSQACRSGRKHGRTGETRRPNSRR